MHGFAVATQLGEVENMVHGFDERGSTCLYRLEERRLDMVERALTEKFGSGKDLQNMSLVSINPWGC